ncbi:hypothetical protein D4A92_24640 (plasmid) [Rhizobium rosettiformans]|uniref:Uncharacterized protein n=1 Tax=Rhizobium rosettiformans TaxID=1368430 RepID=A0ABX7F2J2_9HYPH|nr:hypothetical protein D4A92_24640 [Rhizobium rosettiformans]
MGTEQTPVARRVAELDTIAAVLPMERRDELAELLTDQAQSARSCDFGQLKERIANVQSRRS